MTGPEIGRDLGLRPLTARSVLLSVLLGTHPPELPVRALVRTGALFGIPDGTIRVALSRMVGDGEVEAVAGRYRLTGRLLVRQRRQDEGRAAATVEWDGSWELVAADPGPNAARADLAAVLGPLRLAEWRDGVWVRPANLERRLPAALPAAARTTRTGPLDRPADLVAGLWDLERWAQRARDLIGAMDPLPDPARHFAISAAAVAHLRDDPLLPPELLPGDWPGDRLRRSYSAFEAALTALLRRGPDATVDQAQSAGRDANARHSAG